ncbi:terpenoid synthase [Suillus lakei]|nr:terpenoid synthase [Suillus lakei]
MEEKGEENEEIKNEYDEKSEGERWSWHGGKMRNVRSACDFMNLMCQKQARSANKKDAVMDVLRHPHEPRPKGEWVGGEVARQWVICYLIFNVGTYYANGFWKHTIRNGASKDVVEQAIDRSGHHIHDIQSYFEQSSAFALLELGLDIPDEVISHPIIQDMEITSIDMIFLNNDIVSYNLEQARGDEDHNIVTIVMHELGTDVNGAMLWVADCHTKLETKFLEAMAAIPKWGEPLDSQVREYCNGLGNWVRATCDWSFESERYFGTNGLEIRRKRWIIMLMPKDHLKDREEIGPVLVG